jgi:hypothetical protein
MTKVAEKFLLGKTITKIEWMSETEAIHSGWNNRPIMIELDGKETIYPLMDDEGNDGGALRYYSKSKSLTFPVIKFNRGKNYDDNE